jgi:hypothetical protein
MLDANSLVAVLLTTRRTYRQALQANKTVAWVALVGCSPHSQTSALRPSAPHFLIPWAENMAAHKSASVLGKTIEGKSLVHFL